MRALPAHRARRRHRARSPSTTTIATCASRATAGIVYGSSDAKLASKTLFASIERDLRDHLTRSLVDRAAGQRRAQAVRPAGRIARRLRGPLRPGRRPAAPTPRSPSLRGKYEVEGRASLRDQIAGCRRSRRRARGRGRQQAQQRAVVHRRIDPRRAARRPQSRAGCSASSARRRGRRGRSNAANERVEAAESKAVRLAADLEQIEAELADEITEIDRALDGDSPSTSRRCRSRSRRPTSRSPSSCWPGSRSADPLAHRHGAGYIRRVADTAHNTDRRDCAAPFSSRGRHRAQTEPVLDPADLGIGDRRRPAWSVIRRQRDRGDDRGAADDPDPRHDAGRRARRSSRPVSQPRPRRRWGFGRRSRSGTPSG